jgi:hypothetical protein
MLLFLRSFLLSVVCLFDSYVVTEAHCPFCGTMQGQTLVKEVQQARFVLYGLPSNPQIKRDADGREYSTTDFTIEEVVKNDPFLKNKKTLTLPRYIPPSTNGPEKTLLFCDLNNDQADIYLYLTAKDGALVKYLKEAIKLDEKDVTKRLYFYFNYLDNPDNEVAMDAFKEFAKADYPDVMKMVKAHGDDKMRGKLQTWLKDDNTAMYRYGLLGLMLGLCGKQEDGSVFQAMLDDPTKSLVSGIDGILAGYILVDQAKGWKYTRDLVTNAEKDFHRRYSALRTIRFLWTTHVGHVPEKDLLDAMEVLLTQSDIADLAMDDLRMWKQWKYTKKILELRKRESHIAPIVQRAVLRYMLSCPKDPDAVAYLQAMRKEDPDKVRDAQEFLDIEKTSQAAAATPPTDK